MLSLRIARPLTSIAAFAISLSAHAWGFQPQASGTWADAGSMGAPIGGMSLVGLSGGKAVAIGSLGTQIYDAGTNLWSAGALTLGILPSPTVVALADGRVLVSGGFGFSKIAKIFDPTQNKWTSTGLMKVGRYQHTATLLQDGRVLVAGGGYGANAASAEIYTPSTGTWALTTAMSYSRPAGHSATVLADGRVLVAGGTGTTLNPAEIFDPQSATWTATGPMTSARGGHTASQLSDGRVLVAGGCGGLHYATVFGTYSVSMSLACRTTEILDPGTLVWQSAQSMNLLRTGFTASVLTDGTVLVAGGATSCASLGLSSLPIFKTCLPTNTAEIYDATADTWTFTTAMSVARYNHKATTLSDGRVLVVGGTTNGTALLTSATAYTTN
jgi:hypothetical protein